MIDKRTFCKRFMIGTAVVVAIAVAVIGLCFGRVVEATASAIKATVKSVASLIRTRDAQLADRIDMIDYTGVIKSYNDQINGIIRRDQVSPLIRTIVTACFARSTPRSRACSTRP